jgi:hypothetical protein
VKPIFTIAELIKHGEEEEGVEGVVDEEKGTEAVEMSSCLDFEGLFAEVASQEISAA